MLGHIGCQDAPNHALPEHLHFINIQMFQEICLIFTDYCEALSYMEVFLN